ncbi:MAG TPA: amidohydrolase family protein [Chthonomonadales bacterium]|nr:amidohydrolase family protein [Chthonomonadales bacterium]
MRILDMHTWLGGGVLGSRPANRAAVAQALKDRRVCASVLLAAHARHIDPLAGNRILRAVLEQDSRLYGCVITHVNRPDASVAALRELMGASRMVAMAIAAPSLEAPVNRAVADEILQAFRRYTKPLYLFTPNAACVAAASEIARAYPMLKVVFVGMGGYDWRSAVAAAHQLTNVYLETSGTLHVSKLRVAVESLGPHRIVFGSGAPHVDAAAAAALVESSGLSQDVQARIFWDNAARLVEVQPANE